MPQKQNLATPARRAMSEACCGIGTPLQSSRAANWIKGFLFSTASVFYGREPEMRLPTAKARCKSGNRMTRAFPALKNHPACCCHRESQVRLIYIHLPTKAHRHI